MKIEIEPRRESREEKMARRTRVWIFERFGVDEKPIEIVRENKYLTCPNQQ